MCERKYTKSERNLIKQFKETHEHKCIYCGKELKDNEITIDHLEPIDKGGNTTVDNLGIACKECNKDKANMSYEDYLEYKLEVENAIKNNEAYSSLTDVLSNYDKLRDTYKNTKIQYAMLLKRKHQIEKDIKNNDLNLFQSYKMMRRLKSILKKIDKNIQETKNNKAGRDFANKNKPIIIKQQEELRKELRKELRIKYLQKDNIPRIKDSNILSEKQMNKILNKKKTKLDKLFELIENEKEVI